MDVEDDCWDCWVKLELDFDAGIYLHVRWVICEGMDTPMVAGFVVVRYGFTFSFTDNLSIILSRSLTDILRVPSSCEWTTRRGFGGKVSQ